MCVCVCVCVCVEKICADVSVELRKATAIWVFLSFYPNCCITWWFWSTVKIYCCIVGEFCSPTLPSEIHLRSSWDVRIKRIFQVFRYRIYRMRVRCMLHRQVELKWSVVIKSQHYYFSTFFRNKSLFQVLQAEMPKTLFHSFYLYLLKITYLIKKKKKHLEGK